MKLLAEHREVVIGAHRGSMIAERLGPVIDELGTLGLVAFSFRRPQGRAVVLSFRGTAVARALLHDRGVAA